MYNEGMKNNMDSIYSIVQLYELEEILGPNLNLRIETAKAFISINSKWVEDSKNLLKDAFSQKYFFTYYMAHLYHIKVRYNFIVHVGSFKIMKELPNYPPQELIDHAPEVQHCLKQLEEIATYFHQIGHMQNVCATLSTKYELLHFIKDFGQADQVLTELKSSIELYELKDQKESLELILNDGTTHERFAVFFNDTFTAAESVKQEWKQIRGEMTKMDEDEENRPSKNNFPFAIIHLFPIGYFKFPLTGMNKLFEILNVQEAAKSQFKNIIAQKVIPIANIHYNPILLEGFVDGNSADSGIETWRNIYRIRKAFFEEQFCRVEIK